VTFRPTLSTDSWRPPQEEGEYEGVAYHPGQGGQQEAEMESGVLYQPLEARRGEAQRLDSLRLCKVSTRVRGSHQSTTPCLYAVGFCGEFIEGVKKVAKGAAHAVVNAAHAIVRWARRNYNTLKSVSCNIAGGGAGILAGAGAGLLTENPFAAGLAGALVDRGVTYGCEHQ
jgi:hypothetical protein